MAGSVAALVRPSVSVTPCSDGYWPVNSVVRLGEHAVVLPAAAPTSRSAMPNQEIVRIVLDDVTHGLGGSFGPRGGDSSDEPVIIHPDLDDGDQTLLNITAVPWIYRCVHDGDFQGMFITGKELEIHGVTLVDGRGDTQVLYRYVDWLGVVNQLGLDVELARPGGPGSVPTRVATSSTQTAKSQTTLEDSRTR